MLSPASEATVAGRVRSAAGAEHSYPLRALRALARPSRATAALADTVFLPAITDLVMDAGRRDPRMRTMLLRRVAAYARGLRPLQLYGDEPSEGLDSVVRVRRPRTASHPPNAQRAQCYRQPPPARPPRPPPPPPPAAQRNRMGLGV